MRSRKKKFFAPRFPLWALVLLLDAVAAGADSRMPESTIQGDRLYENLCASCHGPNGRPATDVRSLLEPAPSDLTASRYQVGDSREEIKRVILSGRGRNMLHFEQLLTDGQADALTDFVMRLKQSGRVTDLPSK